MIRFLLTITLFFSLSNAVGTYDTYYFSDTQEKYSLFFLNTSLSTDMTGIGLAVADSTAILGLRPITSLSTVAANANITGRDMLLIRERSASISIPDQSIYSDMNTTLGITNHEANFLFGLTGLIVGMGFYIGFILIITRRH